MNMNLLRDQAIETVATFLEISTDEVVQRLANNDQEIHNMTFQFACAAMAQEKAGV